MAVTKSSFSVPATCHFPGAGRHVGCHGTRLSRDSDLLADASPARIRETLEAIRQLPGGRLHRREAWRDMLEALRIAAAGSDLTVVQAIGRIRNRTRIIGRAWEDRIISRPLLVKGLEYDHSVVMNAERFSGIQRPSCTSR